MPYITQERRKQLYEGTLPPNEAGAGDLTFLLTTTVDAWLFAQGEVRFEKLATAIAALECTKLEFYRRVVRPYEDQKRYENGDVYSDRTSNRVNPDQQIVTPPQGIVVANA